jgi:hypothetical protein
MWESDDEDQLNIEDVSDRNSSFDRKDNPSTYARDSNTYYCPDHGPYPGWLSKCPKCG